MCELVDRNFHSNSQMANLYAKFKKKFTENGIDIIYVEPLSYMCSVLPRNGNVMSSKPNQKVIIICKKVGACEIAVVDHLSLGTRILLCFVSHL